MIGSAMAPQKTCPETAHPIFNYFEDNYVGRLSAANGTRQNPRFDVDSWSCHQRVITGRPRTNNAVEGWNSNFVKLVNGKHPSFPELIEKFQDEQKNAEILIEEMFYNFGLFCQGHKCLGHKCLCTEFKYTCQKSELNFFLNYKYWAEHKIVII